MAGAQRERDVRIAADAGGPLEPRNAVAAVRNVDRLDVILGDERALLVARHARVHRVRDERAHVDHGVLLDGGREQNARIASERSRGGRHVTHIR
jgi:hypothetical protein